MPARLCVLVCLIAASRATFAADLEPVRSVEPQPFAAAAERLREALDYVGSPLSKAQQDALAAAIKNPDGRASVVAIQAVFDPLVLSAVTINAESRVSAVEGPVKKELLQNGWRTFLVKVVNEAGITPKLVINSPNSATPYMKGTGTRQKPLSVDKLTNPSDVPHRFLDIDQFEKQPLKPNLSGLGVEYRIVQLYARDVGRREASFSFSVGQGTQDLGFRGEVPILFNIAPTVEVVFDVRDHDGEPTTAAFTIRDQFNRVYPNPSRRMAPDFFFHQQIYRANGETVPLAPGEYSIEVTRGPEYVPLRKKITVPEGKSHRESMRLVRWIHPRERGWFSGDHHVHAAGCAHYDSPTEGVGPGDMMRHILGEDLNVGCVLSWGPCWYTQKQYFEGKTHALSKPNYLMRYDVEVSGFPSSHAGHLCLLRLTEDDYPGTTLLEDWPSWTLPVLEFGQKQQGVVGYSHSGWGLALPDYMPDGKRAEKPPNWIGQAAGAPGGRAADKLPDDAMPPFDGIGANEYIVTGPLGFCDFISAVDTPSIWELNIWYHTLNCGVTTRISGETDFPCIYGERVGLGRSYVKLAKNEPLDFDRWAQGIKDGRSYVGDGMSHVLDFRASNQGKTVGVGEQTANGVSTLALAKPGKVKVEFDVAAMLEEKETEQTKRVRNARLDAKPYWSIERCRIGETRKVPVELIVNGLPVQRKEIDADGSTDSMSFEVDVPKSSWVAVRVLPSVHTNPIWVTVDGKPVRASKASAEWCKKAVDVCWKSKERNIREPERPTARAAYDQAIKYYDGALAESN